MKTTEAIDHVTYLRELTERTRVRAADAAPFFIVWGVAWIVGYLGAGLLEGALESAAWPVAIGGAALASGIAGSRQPQPRGDSLGRRLQLANAALVVMAVALPLLFGDVERARLNAYYPVVFGFVYIVNGILIGRELLVIGGWLIAAGLVSLAMPDPMQSVWLAVAGGGGLLSTGLVLRRQLRRSAVLSAT